MNGQKEAAVRIRPVTEEDAEELLRIYAPYVKETAISFEYEIPSEEEFRQRIRKTRTRYPYLAAESDGKIIGYAYAGAFGERAAYGWSVETSIYVDRTQRRRHVGQQLYKALEVCLAKQGIQNLNACIAYTEEEDPHLPKDSIHFHQREGYQMVGMFHQCGYKFGNWYHMVWMEKMLGTHPEKPDAVIPYLQLPVSEMQL